MAVIKRETNRGFSLSDANIGMSMTNTASEINLFVQNVGGGKLGVNKTLDFESVNRLSTVLINPTLTIRIRFGTSILTVLNAVSLVSSISTNKPFIIKGKIVNTSATTQYVYAYISQYGVNVPILLNNDSGLADADWTIDTTINQQFSITAQFGSSLTGATLTPKMVTVDVS